MEEHIQALISFLKQHRLLAEKFKIPKETTFRDLVDKYCIEPETLVPKLQTELGLEQVSKNEIDSSNCITQLIDAEYCLTNHCIIAKQTDGTEIIAIANPFNQQAINHLKFMLNHSCTIKIININFLDKLIKESYKIKSQHDLDRLNNQADSVDQDLQKNSPVIAYINNIITKAYLAQASDIHFEPFENQFNIRYRKDGILYSIDTPPKAVANRLITRLKVIARCDIAEKRVPQDGRFKHTTNHKDTIDCRLNSCPTIHGEKIVVRLLTDKNKKIDINTLGMCSHNHKIFRNALSKSQGLILVTGPTGSGKTVTLYAGLNHLNKPDKNIATVEDPVEIKVEGINQVNINPKANLTFSNALRAFLRQDPDIMMVGEIRDKETADIALKAAQTGHLVLSTLHTNSAIEALNRLYNMGVEKYLITSSVSVIISQRLIRILCKHCKQKTKISSKLKNTLPKNFNLEQIYQATGCQHCTHGYQGRTGIYEILVMTESLANAFYSNKLPDYLNQANHQSLIESGIEKVRQGITSLEEVFRVASS